MKNFFYSALSLIVATLSAPALAQVRGAGSHLFPDPSISLSAPPTSPLAAQMQDDYTKQLAGEQRDLLQQNPSGLARRELAIGKSLNGLTPRQPEACG
jgi:hypothetical protein